MTRVSAGILLLLLSPFITVLAQDTGGKEAVPSSPAKSAAHASTSSGAAQTTTKDNSQAGPAQAPTPPDYSQEAYVVEHYSESMRFEDDGTGVIQTDARIKITSESGVQALGQLKVGYSALSDKLEIPYVRVHKPDGTVITAQESAIQDLTFPDAPVYTDYHEKHISVPALRPGDVLEYRFIRTIASPLTPGQFWTSFNFADKGIILDEQLEINVPKDRQIKLKTKPGYDPKITEEGDRRVYRWTHSRLTDDDQDSKKKKRKAHKSEEEVPTVQLTTFRSWQELGAWYAGLERERRVPDAAVKAEAATLVEGKTDDMAKVKALYDYVSRNIRYVSLSFGLGRYQPHAAGEVLANGYGDCKDKNTLLAALLDAEGFHSTSVLIGSKLKLDPDVPSPSQFDHVITRVPVDGKDIWLDSTPGIAPFRMLSVNLRGKQALAILPDGNAELVWTPTALPFAAYDRSTLVGTVSGTGELNAHMTMIGRGDSEMLLRFAMRRMPSSHWKDIFQYVLEHSGMRGADITNLKSTDPSATDDPLQVDFDLKVNNYLDWSAAESKLTLPLSMIGMPDEGDDGDATSTEPIKFGAAQLVEEDQKLTFPAKYKLHPPIGVDVKRDYAEYHSTYKLDGDVFSSKRTLDLLVGEIPRDRAEDYTAFRRVVIADQAQQLTIDNPQPGAADAPAAQNQSADDLNDAGLQALNNGKYQLAVDLFQQVVKLDPKNKTAWNMLGSAYLGLDKTGEAITAFQKQIEINPYDQYAYNNLGEAYLREAKYDQAIQQFQKQLEVDPLDAAAHANLGQVYLRQKKYAQAVPELEKAVDLRPKDPLVKVELGQAYVANGQTDKGMAAFEKAISISPTPLVWNNIAYSLSEQNVQLDRASQYADTAINALETQLRDVKLQNLRMQDLNTSDLLFSVWDTKGWIEYKRGDTKLAEQFITPAWQAGGSGDEAEHLGEISENLGKRDAAVDYYVESMLAENPAFDGRAHLTQLSVKDIEAKMATMRPQMQRERTIPLNKTDKGTASFYLLISPTRVEQVQFIKGDDNLKNFADVLQKTDVSMKFPPNSQAQVVRKAVVHCGTVSPAPCTLELIPSAKVRTLD